MQIFFNPLTSVTAEFTTSNFIFIISYLCKNRLNHAFALSVPQFIL